MVGESVEDGLTAEMMDALRELHVRELLADAEAAEKLDALREMHKGELLEDVETMDEEDAAIPPGGFWQRLDIECETIGIEKVAVTERLWSNSLTGFLLFSASCRWKVVVGKPLGFERQSNRNIAQQSLGQACTSAKSNLLVLYHLTRQCDLCNSLNVSFKSFCQGCRARRPLREPFLPGDWLCNECGNHNYKNKKECASTHCPTRTQKPGDWHSPACGNFNWSCRLLCNSSGCRQPKVYDEAEEARRQLLADRRRS